MPLSIAITITDWVALTTVTGSWTTNTTYNGTYRQVNDTMDAKVVVSLAGAPDAVAFTLNIPNGKTVDESKLPTASTGLYPVGSFVVWDNSLTQVLGTGQVIYNSSSNLLDLYIVTTSPNIMTAVSDVAPITFAINDLISVDFSIPITGW